MPVVTYTLALNNDPVRIENSSTTYRNPEIITLAGGRVAVGWDDTRVNFNAGEFYLYESNGLFVTNNTFTSRSIPSSPSRDIDIVALTGGGFVTAFVTRTSDASGGILGRQFNANGLTTVSEIDLDRGFNPFSTLPGFVSANLNASRPSLAALSNGGYVVAWEAPSTPTADGDIYAAIYAPTSAPVGAPILVEASRINSFGVAAEGYPAGNFALAFTLQDSSGDQTVETRIFDNAGTLLTSRSLSRPGQIADQIDIAITPAGGMAVVFRDGTASNTEISLIIYNANGTNTGVITVNPTTTGPQSDPQIVQMENGPLLVTWLQSTGVTGYAVMDPVTGARLDSTTRTGSNVILADSAVTGVENGLFWNAFSGTPNGETDADIYLVADNEILRTTTGDATNETLVGDGYREVINGAGGDDFLIGGANNDTLNGGDGRDGLFGGEGDDSIIGGEGVNIYDGGEGNDTMGSGLSVTTATQVFLAGQGNDIATGGNGRDWFYGGIGDDVATGGGDTDFLFGDAGIDSLDSGDGDDLIDGGDGNDTVLGGAGSDYLVGGAGNDSINGGLGGNTLVGGAGNDVLFTDATNAATQVVFGEAGDDTATGGAGADYFILDIGNDSANGGGGADTIIGGDGNDTVIGGAGDDLLFGGTGSNTYDGGTGVNYLIFQGAEDVVVVRPGGGTTFVYGFEPGVGPDIIRIEGSAFFSANSMLAAGAILDFSATAGYTIIRPGGGTELILMGISVSQLNTSDFFFV